MSQFVRRYSASDTDKPPKYLPVGESEVVLKDREIRSQKPEFHYQILSPTAARSRDDTVPIGDGFQEVITSALDIPQSLKASTSSSSNGDFLANLNSQQLTTT